MVKHSCGLVLVVFQQPAQPFTTLNGAILLACGARRWKQQDVVFTLVIPLVMIMFHILVEDMTQGVFAKQNDP
jgi:hypothetical protein